MILRSTALARGGIYYSNVYIAQWAVIANKITAYLEWKKEFNWLLNEDAQLYVSNPSLHVMGECNVLQDPIPLKPVAQIALLFEDQGKQASRR
jgi:hypothetical protein